MKKLLSILTITTLTASVPAPLLANTTLTRVKRDVSMLTSNSNNDYLPIKKINGITAYVNSIAVDSKDNVYFSHIIGTTGAYKLTAGSDTATKINGIDKTVNSIVVDSKDNIYFGVADGIYLLKHGETTANKFNKIITSTINSLAVDSSNNIYYGINNSAYVLEHGSTTPTKINGINGFFMWGTIYILDQLVF